ncbi:MAG: phosphate ABC transporter permease subunit PstC [Verrucomicrobiaceae bacterium]|nr:phosphate ABC transporter permease subunit PstC [Verrucomicrobiaceae bacterium]
MSSSTSTTPGSLGSKLLRKGRDSVLGMDPQKIIKNFFGANSGITIVVLVLIMVFLLREGAGFLGTYHQELEVYRKAGLEFCDIADTPLKEQQLLTSALRRAKTTTDAALKTALTDAEDAFDTAIEPAAEILLELKTHATETKELATEHHTLEAGRQQLLEAAAGTSDAKHKADLLKEAELSKVDAPDYAERIATMLERRGELSQALTDYTTALETAAATLPEAVSDVKKAVPAHVATIRKATENLQKWSWEEPVSYFTAVRSFLFGSAWITNSSWHDIYGVVPLLVGSLLISLVALLLATPISISAAIYTNQFATDREKEIIKPVIEFIQAIPSVVLGFIGIAVVGDLIKGISQWELLSWVPGFPIQERLNIFNAGFLLAFMAVPTMFSLAEDALNNVPRAYAEASDALGATKLQTVFRVIVPAALSGILSAILLGLGRVVGETMVVLLVAGNRIAIPDFGDGVGVIFQPAHTLTGIIAQELGEVSRGSSHWQALFMVGILLFLISLAVNGCARAIAKRFEHSKA